MKITVIGAAGVRTPLLVHGLATAARGTGRIMGGYQSSSGDANSTHNYAACRSAALFQPRPSSSPDRNRRHHQQPERNHAHAGNRFQDESR